MFQCLLHKNKQHQEQFSKLMFTKYSFYIKHHDPTWRRQGAAKNRNGEVKIIADRKESPLRKRH